MHPNITIFELQNIVAKCQHFGTSYWFQLSFECGKDGAIIDHSTVVLTGFVGADGFEYIKDITAAIDAVNAQWETKAAA